MIDLETLPKWRLYMILPILGVAAVVGFIIMKLRHTGPDATSHWVEMTEERKRMMIEADQLDRIGRGEELS